MSTDKRPTDVSVDIETLGNSYGAAILSIGAASFNRDTGKIGPTYYVKIGVEESLRYGQVDASTLLWWMKQSQDARNAVFSDGGQTMKQALQGFNAFTESLPADVCVWGNSATFDITLLDGAFDALKFDGCYPKWRKAFWCIRDLRTLVDLADVNPKSLPFTGTPHHALDDAIHQAKIAAACFAKLKAPRTKPEEEVGEW